MSSVPRTVQAVEPKSWQAGLAPVYIGMFLWIAFFDQLGRRALPVGGLGWSMLGAAAAGPLAYLLLYRVPATWGRQVGRGIAVVSTSTFGARGAALVPGLLIGIGQVVLFAVAVAYAVDLTFQGLAAGRLVDPRSLRPVLVGGSSMKPPLVLATTLAWAVATALVGARFVRWISFLMQFFPIFPAVLLGATMLAMLGGLRSFVPGGVDPMTGRTVPIGEGSVMAFQLTLQWVFAFAALAGLFGADWGSGSLGLRDVRIGGWVGMGLAPAIVSALSLISVAGYQGSSEANRAMDDPRLARPTIQELPGTATAVEASPYTFRAVVVGGFDRRVSCAMLLVFGLASLGPAVYSAFVFGERFAAIGPGISTIAWTLLGTATAWLLIVGGWADRVETVLNVLGAAFPPVAGAMAADSLRHRGRWPGPRRGLNPAGMIAWALGCAVGLAPILARPLGSERLARLQPAALAAFVVAFALYGLLALCRLESGPAKADAE